MAAYKSDKKDAVDTVAILKKDLAGNNPARLYLFHGEESYLRSHYLGMLEKQCAGVFPDFDLVRLDGDTVTAAALRDAIESLPMGGERKLIEVIDYNIFGSGTLKEALPDVLANLPEYVCLVFVFEAIEYKPDKRTTLYKTVQQYGQEVEFKRASNSELVSWVRRRFNSLNKDISSADAERLIFTSGGLMTNLITEIEKIAAGAAGKTVTAKDIDNMASRSLEAGVFDLTDCLSEGNISKALLVLSDLMDMKNSAVAIVAAVTKHFRRMYGARLGVDSGASVQELTKLLEFRSDYATKKLISVSSSFSLRRLRRAQKLCLEADIALKSNNADDKRIVELLLMRIMV
ncbi:MAG: DNA polymerase III subunit delta [Clostridia bacterium]|nr:DNA polymerase III subunit delta [Clostridia bacterium]